MNRLTAALLLVLGSSSMSFAATTVVTLESGTPVLNSSSAALSGGTAAAGDGTVLQLGYFTGATAANNFTGTWVPLTGAGSANTAYNTTSIGDLSGNGAGDGTFAFEVVFDPAVAGQNQNLPAGTTIPLAIRFYDATTVGGASYYNTVSNDAWLWKVPANPSPLPPTINISLDGGGLEWEGGAGTEFKTTIATAVPEPGRFLLGLIGLAFVGFRRRR